MGHSLSPRLHGYWLRHYGIDGAYIPLPVRPQDFETAVRALPLLGMRGANVTVPHKEAAFNVVDEADPVAKRLKAVNTIVVAADGKLLGQNSDGYGFMESLRAAESGWQPDAGTAAVIGAGGAARGIVAALQEAGVSQICLTNRTARRAERLAADLNGGAVGKIETIAWNDRENYLGDAALVVNATSLGMAGDNELPLSLNQLPTTATVVDIVYNPLETPLLAAARARGNPAIDGLGMLLHQARQGFAAWFGIDPEVTEELRQYVLAGLEESAQ